MDSEELRYLEQQQRESALYNTQIQQGQAISAQQEMAIAEQERGMIREQLDLSEELEYLENLLRGNILQKDEQGLMVWMPPEDKEMIILSDYGIHLIMNTINFYINKNTLLSNYTEELINDKMKDFAESLADTVFMEYEKVFQYPTFEECKAILLNRIDKKKELKKFALELGGRKADEEKIKDKILKELEGQIDKEILKIREQIVKNKLKRFLILIREIQDAVHSTYLRAWNGQERRTLRQHIHISEQIGQPPMQQPKKGFFGRWK